MRIGYPRILLAFAVAMSLALLTSQQKSAAQSPTSDLQVTISVPTPVGPGQQVRYDVSLTNTGPQAATNVVLTITVPPNGTFNGMGMVATLGGAFVTPPPGNVGPGTITYPNFPVGFTATSFLLVFTDQQAPSGQALTSTASVTATQLDPTPANNSATATAVVANTADLQVTKTVSPASTTPGGTLTYTLTLTNNGPQSSLNIVLTDTLPAGSTLVSATQLQPFIAPMVLVTTPTSVTITGGMSPGASNSASFSIVVRVSPTAQGSVTNTASVTAQTLDPNLANNSASATAAIVPVPTPTVTPTATPTPIPPVVPVVPAPVFQNPAAGGIFNPIAKTPTPRPVAVVDPYSMPLGQGTAGVTLRPPNTGDAGLKALEEID